MVGLFLQINLPRKLDTFSISCHNVPSRSNQTVIQGLQTVSTCSPWVVFCSVFFLVSLVKRQTNFVFWSWSQLGFGGVKGDTICMRLPQRTRDNHPDERLVSVGKSTDKAPSLAALRLRLRAEGAGGAAALRGGPWGLAGFLCWRAPLWAG